MGTARIGALLPADGAAGLASGGGGTSAADAACSSMTKVCSGCHAGVGGGNGVSFGVVTTGGKGCAQLLFAFRGGFPWVGVATGRGAAERGRTGGGGCVPEGTPSASRKRRTRSSSVGGGARRMGSFGGEAGGLSSSPELLLVSHLKTSASAARTKKMTVSFIWEVTSDR